MSATTAPSAIAVPTASVLVTPQGIVLCGQPVATDGSGADLLVSAYRRYVADYPRFFKMDGLCRLGFVATELLLGSLGEERFADREDRAVVLLNRSASHEADARYQQSIGSPADFFPSPAAFVYTLPNIVTGEIAIRNHYLGETSFHIVAQRDEALQARIVSSLFADATVGSALVGWADYVSGDDFLADIALYTRTPEHKT